MRFVEGSGLYTIEVICTRPLVGNRCASDVCFWHKRNMGLCAARVGRDAILLDQVDAYRSNHV